MRPKDNEGYPHLITNATMEVIPMLYPTGIPRNSRAIRRKKKMTRISI